MVYCPVNVFKGILKICGMIICATPRLVANSPIAVFVFILKCKMIMMVSFALEIPVPQPMRTPYVSTITLKEGANSDAKHLMLQELLK